MSFGFGNTMVSFYKTNGRYQSHLVPSFHLLSDNAGPTAKGAVNREQTLEQFFITYTGRIAGVTEMAKWQDTYAKMYTNNLAASHNDKLTAEVKTLRTIRDVFANSAEHKKLIAKTPVEQIKTVFQNFLGRIPTARELKSFVKGINKGEITSLTQVTNTIFNSDERIKRSNEPHPGLKGPNFPWSKALHGN